MAVNGRNKQTKEIRCGVGRAKGRMVTAGRTCGRLIGNFTPAESLVPLVTHFALSVCGHDAPIAPSFLAGWLVFVSSVPLANLIYQHYLLGG